MAKWENCVFTTLTLPSRSLSYTKIKNIPHIDNYTLKKQKHPNALPHTTVFPFTHTGASQ